MWSWSFGQGLGKEERAEEMRETAVNHQTITLQQLFQSFKLKLMLKINILFLFEPDWMKLIWFECKRTGKYCIALDGIPSI